MLGLLIKDLINVRKQAIWYAAVVVVFAVLSVVLKNGSFSAAIGILLTISVPLTAAAYEERDGWPKFVAASGLPRAAVVAEKYVLGLLFWLLSAAVYVAAYFIMGAEDGAVEFVLPVCLPLIVLAAVMPLVIKFGVEKARAYMIAVVVVFMALYIALIPALKDALASGLVFSLCMAAGTLVLLGLSFVLSLKIYKKKEF